MAFSGPAAPVHRRQNSEVVVNLPLTSASPAPVFAFSAAADDQKLDSYRRKLKEGEGFLADAHDQLRQRYDSRALSAEGAIIREAYGQVKSEFEKADEDVDLLYQQIRERRRIARQRAEEIDAVAHAEKASLGLSTSTPVLDPMWVEIEKAGRGQQHLRHKIADAEGH